MRRIEAVLLSRRLIVTETITDPSLQCCMEQRRFKITKRVQSGMQWQNYFSAGGELTCSFKLNCVKLCNNAIKSNYSKKKTSVTFDQQMIQTKREKRNATTEPNFKFNRCATLVSAVVSVGGQNNGCRSSEFNMVLHNFNNIRQPKISN